MTKPLRKLPPASHPHFEIWTRVKESLAALPQYFDTKINIEGIRATDVFTLNSTLGATIEEQVVKTLNNMRPVWDPDDKYSLYGFVRQPQTFPDVLLKKIGGDEILFGIELKGWYVLSKEGEPSFRYQVTPAACALLDLIAIVPWYLTNVISGTPQVYPPYVESALYAAEYRNWWWQHGRRTSSDSTVIPPDVPVFPYPSKSDKISDRAKVDGGGNFGRYARTGIMDEYIEALNGEELSGIQIRYWLQFFQMFQQDSDASKIASAFKSLVEQVAEGKSSEDVSDFGLRLLDALRREFGLEE